MSIYYTEITSQSIGKCTLKYFNYKTSQLWFPHKNFSFFCNKMLVLKNTLETLFNILIQSSVQLHVVELIPINSLSF